MKRHVFGCKGARQQVQGKWADLICIFLLSNMNHISEFHYSTNVRL
jgi:hypothetical protein